MNVCNLEMACSIFCSGQNWFQWNLDEFPKDSFFESVTLIQTFAISICAIIGIVQFAPWLYRKYPRLHFAVGNVYVMLVLFMGGPTTIIISLNGKNVFDIGIFLVLGGMYWHYTKKAIYAISNRKWLEHLTHMQMSYIITITMLVMIMANTYMGCITYSVLAILCVYLRRIGFNQRLLKSYKIKN